MLTAAVASLISKNGAYLRACLEQTGLTGPVAEWSAVPERHPAPGESVPDVVLIDLDREQDACFAFATQLRKLRPASCLIACSTVQQPGPEVLMQAMRSGMQEFLSIPVEVGRLREILERIIRERGPSAEPAVEKLTVVMGSKGGVGSTTVAVNLGAKLAGLTRKRVTLLDFARPFGHVGLLLDLQARFTVRHAVENLERLDTHFLSGLLTRHSSGLEVLAGATDVDEWQLIPVSALPRVVNVAQSTCDFLLMDLGSVYSSEWSSVLQLARTIVVVAQADVPALWTLERHISALTAMGVEPERLQIIINRWRRSDDDALKAFEKKIKRSIFARIPNDFQQVSEAANQGAPLSRNHNDPLTSRFSQLASQMGGIAAPSAAKGSAILNLFNRVSTR
jgi:pilus assembly protein CpaE